MRIQLMFVFLAGGSGAIKAQSLVYRVEWPKGKKVKVIIENQSSGLNHYQGNEEELAPIREALILDSNSYTSGFKGRDIYTLEPLAAKQGDTQYFKGKRVEEEFLLLKNGKSWAMPFTTMKSMEFKVSGVQGGDLRITAFQRDKLNEQNISMVFTARMNAEGGMKQLNMLFSRPFSLKDTVHPHVVQLPVTGLDSTTGTEWISYRLKRIEGNIAVLEFINEGNGVFGNQQVWTSSTEGELRYDIKRKFPIDLTLITRSQSTTTYDNSTVKLHTSGEVCYHYKVLIP
jgi:hypothetical protein